MSNQPDPELTPYQDEHGPTLQHDEAGHWMRDRLEQEVGGRPLILYLLVAAGLAVLVLLAIIIWVSARGDGRSAQAICLDIDPQEAINQVLAGNVNAVYVIVDTSHPELGPAALQLEMKDNTCRITPQGVDNRDSMLQVLGAVEYSNTIGESRIRSEYRRESVPAELMATTTPTVDPNGVVDETPTIDPNATESAGEETPTPLAAPNQTPPPDESPTS